MSAGAAIAGALTGFTFGALTGGRRYMPYSYGFGYGYNSTDVNSLYINPLDSNNDARVNLCLSNPMGFGGIWGMPYLSCGGFIGSNPFMSGYMLGYSPCCWYC